MKVITPIEKYDLLMDTRILIPVFESGKVGFIDHSGAVIVDPKYDAYKGEFYNDNDLIVVSKDYLYAYERKTTSPATYCRPLYGLLNSKGEEVLKTEYFSLVRPKESLLIYSVQNMECKYGVVDCYGNILIPFGKYDYIDGFYKGFARVKVYDASKENKEQWGIINEKGQLVLPIEYDNIWNFYGKEYVTLVKDSSSGCTESILVEALDLPF